MVPCQTVMFGMTTQMTNTHLSVVSMVLLSNDGFVGLDALHIPTEIGSYSYYLNAHDAGTEFNSELAGTIPGPADETVGGGYNAIRDAVTLVVTLHGGIVGEQDGFSESTLTGADKFDIPTLRIEVFAL